VDLSEFWLSEEQFERLRPFLPDKVCGVARVDDRRVISGIIHVLKSGGRWVDAPACYGPRKTLYNRFVRWAAKGVWQKLFVTLAAAGGPPAEVLIDSTHMKAHRSASGGKGGPAIKRSAPVGADATASSMLSPMAKAARSDSC
jgi:transposase